MKATDGYRYYGQGKWAIFMSNEGFYDCFYVFSLSFCTFFVYLVLLFSNMCILKGSVDGGTTSMVSQVTAHTYLSSLTRSFSNTTTFVMNTIHSNRGSIEYFRGHDFVNTFNLCNVGAFRKDKTSSTDIKKPKKDTENDVNKS